MADLLVRRAGRVFGHDGEGPWAVVVDDGAIGAVVPERELRGDDRHRPELDAAGAAVIPGFVDAHTHLVFAGDRSAEFEARLAGTRYAAGGIMSTVEATRAASFDELVSATVQRAEEFLRSGTTTIEAKSGYALEPDGELRLLEVLRAADQLVAAEIIPTFLGAHLDLGDGYVDAVIDEMLPACAPLARFCDVFCDLGALTVGDSRRVLTAARSLGLGLRIHADELARTGGAMLAAEMGCVSADHLVHVDAADAAALAATGVVAVLLPATSFSLRSAYAPARALLEAGVTIALSTDCNPGTSYTTSMPFVIALACSEYGLAADEAVTAATAGGAAALGRNDIGSLHVGARADMVVLDAERWSDLAYRPGANLIRDVVKDGALVAGTVSS